MISSKSKNVIEDGYTKRAYIAAKEGLHEGIEFEFRPMLPEANEDLETILKKFEGSKAVRSIAKAIVDHVTEWSEVDKDGKPRKVTFEDVCRLPKEILRDMRHIIQGTWPGDPIPDPSKEEQSDYTKSLLDAAEGKAPGIEQSEADRKN